jgi:translocation and assembly module TamB
MAEGVEQASDTPRMQTRDSRRLGRGARIMLGIVLLILLALVAAWLARKPIAARVIDRELARRGVVARYDVSDLGFGRQRLTNVVIGDPAAPDLVADWVEAETRIGLDGASLYGVRAGHVRLRGRLVSGKLTLGELDKLMGPASGKRFALSKLYVNVADARMRLDTPVGTIGLKAAGRGRLDDGFAGNIAMASDRLTRDGCAVTGLRAALRVRIADAAPHVAGPMQAVGAGCQGASMQRFAADLDARLGPALDTWRGSARVRRGRCAAQAPGRRACAAHWGSTAMPPRPAVPSIWPRAMRACATGWRRRWAYRGLIGSAASNGSPAPSRRAVPASRRRHWRRSTCVGLAAVRRSARCSPPYRKRFSGTAVVALRHKGSGTQLRVTRAHLSSASGARAQVTGGTGLALAWPNGRVRIDTGVSLSGGGLPRLAVSLAQDRPGAPVRGRMTMAPYAAGNARLALAPVTFTATPGGATRVVTRATLSGPLGDGRVEGLALPLDLRWNGRGTVVANSGCTPLSIARLRVSGLTLDPLRTTLCPSSGALLTLANGRVSGGVRLAATRLSGRLGQTPLTLAASGAHVRLGDRGFVVEGVAARLGKGDRVTRIDLGELTGRLEGGTVVGTFAGAAGQIANVPLLLDRATGDWSLRGGGLALRATMTVSDAAADPRFRTLDARNVTLRLANGSIAAGGALYEPTQRVKVADVTIGHRLASGSGSADIAVPNIVFDERFQPDLLTRLTYGVVAEVRARVTGAGHIAWSPQGVTSTGEFATRDAALAAAFGPVTGITTTIRFTDLLGLQSAPAQVATIGTVNPGIAVTGGTLTYRLLANTRVQIDSGVWPFAGGRMTLLPTTLDFAEAGARRMTFRLDGVAADQFLQQFDFENLTATGTFGGELPMIFDIAGGRIENGRLTVRPGGGSLAYVGDLTQKDLGLWGNIAFQALKSLRYRNLTIGMNGPLAGEMVTEVRFAGVTQGQGAKSNVIVRRLQRLPFVFNIRIKAPFRGLLDSAQSFYDPRRLVQRKLPELMERQKLAPTATPPVAIQPPASEVVP